MPSSWSPEARAAPDLPALRDALSAEIADETRRRRFLAAVERLQTPAHGPGLLFSARLGADGLMPEPDLRARTEVAVLAVPTDALELVESELSCTTGNQEPSRASARGSTSGAVVGGDAFDS